MQTLLAWMLWTVMKDCESPPLLHVWRMKTRWTSLPLFALYSSRLSYNSETAVRDIVQFVPYRQFKRVSCTRGCTTVASSLTVFIVCTMPHPHPSSSHTTPHYSPSPPRKRWLKLCWLKSPNKSSITSSRKGFLLGKDPLCIIKEPHP